MDWAGKNLYWKYSGLHFCSGASSLYAAERAGAARSARTAVWRIIARPLVAGLPAARVVAADHPSSAVYSVTSSVAAPWRLLERCDQA